MTRVAAVDCGTNSLRLLVADLDVASGRSEQLERRTRIVRLGQGVDQTGCFAASALERTFAVVEEYAGLVAAHDVEAVRFVATSAARDVENRQAFLDGVHDRLAVIPDVIGGDEEARLTFRGATRELGGLDWIERPMLVVDIGGGSTEFVTRYGDSGPITGQSVDIGSVRLTERHLHADPPTAAQVQAVTGEIDRGLDSLRFDLDTPGTVIGVAGTVTTMAAMVLQLPRYDREIVDKARLPAARLLGCIDAVVHMSVAERRGLPFMHPDRADVIGAGALVLAGVVRRTGCAEVVSSTNDILDGIAWSLA